MIWTRSVRVDNPHQFLHFLVEEDALIALYFPHPETLTRAP